MTSCIEKVGANDDRGYHNAFTDAVSTAPVVDRTSALKAYEARMTYGFSRMGEAGKKPVVPEGAEDLLITAFPDLTDAQRRAVLAATEIDSGYPLDSTSEGWQRINLPEALSSKDTLDSAGTWSPSNPASPSHRSSRPAASVSLPPEARGITASRRPSTSSPRPFSS